MAGCPPQNRSPPPVSSSPSSSPSRELLQNILSVNLISAWAAIFFAPTLVGTIYGMNFRHMPELKWALGYPYTLGLMAVMCIGLYVMFTRRGWI